MHSSLQPLQPLQPHAPSLHPNLSRRDALRRRSALAARVEAAFDAWLRRVESEVETAGRALRAAEAQLGRKLTPPRCLSGGAESFARRVGELAAAVVASGERLRRRESMVCGVWCVEWCVEYGVWSMVCGVWCVEYGV